MAWWFGFLGVLLVVSIAVTLVCGRKWWRMVSRPRGIFISYAGRDRAKAMAVRGELERKGYAILMYDPTALWPSEWAGMARSMRDAHAVLFLRPDEATGLPDQPGEIAEEAVTGIKTPSPYIQAELALARMLRRPVVQVNSDLDLRSGAVDLATIGRPVSPMGDERAIIIAAKVFEEYFPDQDVRDMELTQEKLAGDVEDTMVIAHGAFAFLGVVVGLWVALAALVTIAVGVALLLVAA